MKVLEAGDWSLLLPPEWFAEQEDDSIMIMDRDGIGCLEISELRRDDAGGAAPVSASGLDDVKPLLDEGSDWQRVTCGSLQGYRAALEEGGEALREWYLATGDLLLYITYSCDAADRGMDDAAVDEILDTLRYARED